MKRLGQHFLKNGQALKKIVEALELKSGDVVIEIGAGHGELTEVIEHETRNIKRGIKIVAIEKDEKLAELLRKKFSVGKNIEIIEGDALQIIKKFPTNIIPQLWHDISNKGGGAENLAGFKIVGNIPYYITGHLFRVIGELEHRPELCAFTIQKEVAERIAAEPPRMNRLAASVQFWAEPKIIMRLPKSDFEPPPKVDSAIVRLKVESGRLKVENEKYYKTVRMLFAQPRKTILNNVSHSTYHVSREKIMEKLKRTGINPEDRPQNLSVEDIIKIAAVFGF